jgi:hypothetical protein
MKPFKIDKRLKKALESALPLPLIHTRGVTSWGIHELVFYTSIEMCIRDCILSLAFSLGPELVNLNTLGFYLDVVRDEVFCKIYGAYITHAYTNGGCPATIRNFDNHRPMVYTAPVTLEDDEDVLIVGDQQKILFGTVGIVILPRLNFALVVGYSNPTMRSIS